LSLTLKNVEVEGNPLNRSKNVRLTVESFQEITPVEGNSDPLPCRGGGGGGDGCGGVPG
jgi:hypothetical protein